MENGNKIRRASRRKYHYIYKTVCLITKNYYIGMHSTDNLNDGYIGSGKRLWYSIKKHGKENHQKEIIEFLPTRKDLVQREANLVNEDLLKDPMCMNLKVGGEGGLGFISEEQQRRRSIAGGAAFKRKLKEDLEFYQEHIQRSSLILKKAHSEGKIKYDNFTGKVHSEETKKKISDSSKGKGAGNKNSQFGTCWIHNVETKQCIKIKNTEIDSYISEGWTKGRKMKF